MKGKMELSDGAWDLARKIGQTQERNRIIKLLMKDLTLQKQLSIEDVIELITKGKK